MEYEEDGEGALSITGDDGTSDDDASLADDDASSGTASTTLFVDFVLLGTYIVDNASSGTYIDDDALTLSQI